MASKCHVLFDAMVAILQIFIGMMEGWGRARHHIT